MDVDSVVSGCAIRSDGRSCRRCFDGPAIYVFWHETIPLPIYMRPNCRLSMLLSQHQDAEVLSHVAHFAGLQVVRGSSNRGGTSALRTMIERGKGMSLAITPDGPRGPRRVLAQGCIYLSSRLQIPIVPIMLVTIDLGEIAVRGTNSLSLARSAAVEPSWGHDYKCHQTLKGRHRALSTMGPTAIGPAHSSSRRLGRTAM
ncbi:MAG: DUF374 domain-containing protein [Pirellulaceae bacterium]